MTTPEHTKPASTSNTVRRPLKVVVKNQVEAVPSINNNGTINPVISDGKAIKSELVAFVMEHVLAINTSPASRLTLVNLTRATD